MYLYIQQQKPKRLLEGYWKRDISPAGLGAKGCSTGPWLPGCRLVVMSGGLNEVVQGGTVLDLWATTLLSLRRNFALLFWNHTCKRVKNFIQDIAIACWRSSAVKMNRESYSGTT